MIKGLFIINVMLIVPSAVFFLLPGQQLSMLNESKQYVQGVVWDPVGQYVVTLSSDRYVRKGHVLKSICVHLAAESSVYIVLIVHIL